jgi:iron complex outermembrane receptor protein
VISERDAAQSFGWVGPVGRGPIEAGSNRHGLSMRHDSLPVKPSPVAVPSALGGLVFAASIGLAGAQMPPLSSDTALPDVIVTGSRIPVPNDVAISPVYAVDATLVQQSGVTRIEDLLNSLPQVRADQGANASITSDGTAAVNLRGLGSGRTLVLVNGRRLGPGDPGGGTQSDLNAIPADLVERIELLTGGASSVYGADAVAGVVNFKLLDHFEGVKLTANYDFYSHSNDNAQGVVDAVINWNSTTGANYPLAPVHVDTGFTKDLSLIAGVNSAHGMGNATFYATYRAVAAVAQSQFSYSACTFASGYLAGPNSTGGKFQCAGSPTSYPGSFWALDPTTGQPIGSPQTIGPQGALVPSTNATLYNYGPLNYDLRPDQRYTAGAFLHYEFDDHVTAYSEMQYMSDRTVAQIAPSGLFFTTGPYTVNCNNPEFSASMVTSWCGGSTSGNALLFIGRRNIEGGPRLSEFDHTSWRLVMGARGKIDEAWQYDLSGQISTVQLEAAFRNDQSLSRISNALNVVSYNSAGGTIGAGGVPTCTSALPSSFNSVYSTAGTDSACVPWNIFQIAGVTSKATSYLAIAESSEGTIAQQILSANMTGDLGKYGVRFLTAKEGVKINVGAEWREVKSKYNPDLAEQSGDGAGFGIPAVPIAGKIVARESFAEIHIPVVQDRSLAKSLNFDTGHRYSEYSLGFATNTYKFGLEWSPVGDVRLRGSWSRAVRAPNLGELFYPRTLGGDGSTDPCSGTTPQFSLALCQRTGVTSAEYGNVVPSPTSTYNGLTGGNRELRPETATTMSFGIGWSPSFMPGVHVQMDYYYIQIPNIIQTIGADTILRQCLNLDLFCNLIHRDVNGSLWVSQHGYVVDALANVGEYTQKGIDLDLRYSFDGGSHGTFRASIVGTYVIDNINASILADPATSSDCTGLYGPLCGQPTFRWRHTGRVTWETPSRRFEASVAWRYFGAVTLDALSSNPNLAAPPGYTIGNGGISNTDARLRSRSYIDLTAVAQINNRLTCRVGVNNVLDKDPPVIGTSNHQDGPTFAQVYDSLGRYVFAAVTARF